MSLRPENRASRSRSKSPGRARDKSPGNVRAPSPSPQIIAAPETYTSIPQYDARQPIQTATLMSESAYTMGNYTDLPPHERPDVSSAGGRPLTWNYTTTPINQPGAGSQHLRNISYTAASSSAGYKYAPTPDTITFSAKPVTSPQPTVAHVNHQQLPSNQLPYPPTDQPFLPQLVRNHQGPQPSLAPPGSYSYGNVVEVSPGGGKPPASPRSRPHSLSFGGHDSDQRAPSPSRMDRLSVSGNRPDVHAFVPGEVPPASPLLEAYHGTYQSISPMPSPMLRPHDDIDDLPPLTSQISASSKSRHHRSASGSHRKSKEKDKERDGGREREKRVKIYDAEQDALDLVEALSPRTPDPGPLIDILSQLNHDQMLELRNEYKRHCKVQGRGINIAKHIKMKTGGSFGKICYVTALGRWESESYWANTWYQSSNARRELLIEALMGRSNMEVHEIKKAFKDKRYDDDLQRCMEKELKADKFRKAVLMALDEKRQEEQESWPMEYRNRDVDTLYRAVKAREGGESAMLEVVITRSDNHLRDVLKTYERKYQGNFAREALRRSNNLVGEVIAHILNGVINKPARDAMLLHHALMDLIEPSNGPTPSSSSGGLSSRSKHERQQRVELLISRLVRLHWDRLHLMRVKDEYEHKYGREIEYDIEEATKGGEFQDFCIALCEIGK